LTGTQRRATRPATLIIIGQISFVGFLALSIALHPGFVLKADEGGVSNYGIHLKTTVSYSLAFGLCAWLSCWAAIAYRRAGHPTRRLAVLLFAYGGLLGGDLLSTYVYKVDEACKQLHGIIGVATFCLELGASIWMSSRLRTARARWSLLVQLAGSVLAGLTSVGVLHVLFLGQALASIGFGLLLIDAGLRADRDPRAFG
jgi:hypothetical protein